MGVTLLPGIPPPPKQKGKRQPGSACNILPMTILSSSLSEFERLIAYLCWFCFYVSKILIFLSLDTIVVSHADVFRGGRLSSLPTRGERRAPLKTSAWEANAISELRQLGRWRRLKRHSVKSLKLHCSYSISFNFSNVGEFFWSTIFFRNDLYFSIERCCKLMNYADDSKIHTSDPFP